MKNLSALLIRYPFAGVLEASVFPDYAKVINPILSGIIANINTYCIKERRPELMPMEKLVGKPIAFSLGGSAFRYNKKKTNWNSSIVEWILLDDIREGLTPENYQSARTEELLAINNQQFFCELTANWYFELWDKFGHEKPIAKLRSDSLLDNKLKALLSTSTCLEQLVWSLDKIFSSPYYAIDDNDRQKVHTKFFEPSLWNKNVFIPQRSLEEYSFYNVVWQLCGTDLLMHMNRARVAAIDLETNGDRIWEFGWKNSEGIGKISELENISDTHLQEAIDKSILNLMSPCIVGHNLLNWDLPILQKRNISFPESSEFWDTLLASWILEPWNSTHALIVATNGHRADADAVKCYELFEEQIKLFTPCLSGIVRDIQKLIHSLFIGTSDLSTIKNRSYPSVFKKKNKVPNLYPNNRIGEISWQQDCFLEYCSPEWQEKDPTLSPTICENFAKESGWLKAQVISIIVKDAEANFVQVRLSMLPAWLVDEMRNSLLAAHYDHTPNENNKSLILYIAEDIFALPSHMNSDFLNDPKLFISHAYEISNAWQTSNSQNLSEEEVRISYPNIIAGHSGRKLFSVNDKEANVPAWILCEPPVFGSLEDRWHLLAPIPNNFVQLKKPVGNSKLWASLPQWKDGEIANLEVDRLFITPDTANRRLYLADIAHCILNLQRELLDDQILIIGIRWPCEADQLQSCLAQLSLSVLHSDSPLRQIERLQKEKLRLIACSYDNLSEYVDAAKRLGQSIQITIDEVPLHNWYCMLHPPKENDEKSIQIQQDIIDFNEDINENDDFKAEQDDPRPLHIVLKPKDLKETTLIFLNDWLGLLMKSDSPLTKPIIIIDSRLSNHLVSKLIDIPLKPVPFYQINELLDENKCELFQTVCFPKSSEIEIPNTYKSYQDFLKENWGYPDFLEGTQKPAIESLIENNRDLLLRLPTGAGKSEVFQVPTLLRSNYSQRLSIVVTPLRALMKDQVERLWKLHFRESVDYLSAGREAWVNHDVYQGILDGRIKLIYIAPERFRNQKFTELLERRRQLDGGLDFLVFDEAHCVSEWGFEFRPDYLFAARFIAEWFRDKKLPGNPHRVLLTSATITKRNQRDLERELNLRPGQYNDLPKDMPHPIQPFIVLESYDIPECYEIQADEKYEKIKKILSSLDLSVSAALIFVRKRRDCHRISQALNEEASLIGSNISQVQARPFHAGLTENVKTEATELLKKRDINVLVCTKAFGMGMDVSHLHACIHYQPPTFIEDYLQEVGRIGRKEEERKKANRKQVVASLLFNNDNIERNNKLLRESIVKPPDLQDFFNYCLGICIKFSNIGKSICILPSKIRINESKSFNENQVTSCLFWLERMKTLKVEGRNPPILKLTIHPGDLKKFSTSEKLAGNVARGLLAILDGTTTIVKEPEKKNVLISDQNASETSFNRFIRGIVRGVLALVPPHSEKKEDISPDRNGESRTINHNDEIEISFSITEIMTAGGGLSNDDLYTGLVELSRAKALKLHKIFVITRAQTPSTDEFWGLLQYSVEMLLRPTRGKLEILPKKEFEQELTEWYCTNLKLNNRKDSHISILKTPNGLVIDTTIMRRIRREVYRVIGTSLKLLRYSGIEFKENISTSGATEYLRVIPTSSIANLQRDVTEKIEMIKNLVKILNALDPHPKDNRDTSFEVELFILINELGKEIRMSQLRDLMNLLESSGFYGVSNFSEEWVYIVSMTTLEHLPPWISKTSSGEADSGNQNLIQETYFEMSEKEELQVLRAQCMVLLMSLPNENRKQFIDKYFQCLTSKDLENCIKDSIGEVSDETLASNKILYELSNQVRKERFGIELNALNIQQREVCEAPYNINLFVNAGPGSGKTRLLIMRCAHLIHIQKIKPSEILVLAFNRAVVFEIKERIQILFKEIGYGSYVKSIDITTLHGFVLRHSKTSFNYDEDATNNSMYEFAQNLRKDRNLCKRIATRYKSILVDEFQDMNPDFYNIVQSLSSNIAGGTMVIGDDDQDILGWNRKEWNNRNHIKGPETPLEVWIYFDHFKKKFNPKIHTLILNYRSVHEIVKRSNDMIALMSKHYKFKREKSGTLLEANRNETGLVKELDEHSLGTILRKSMDLTNNDETVVVLCKTNEQCKQVFEMLTKKENIPAESLNILGDENNDFFLHQMRSIGTIMDICSKHNEWEFVEPYMWNHILDEYIQIGHPDSHKSIENLKILFQLIQKGYERPRIRDILDFIKETKYQDFERLVAKNNLGTKSKEITISTVHKVKGLEFDTVIIMPSARRKNKLNQIENSSEEIRLFYVAMTRAKNSLYGGWVPEWGPKVWPESKIFSKNDADLNCKLEGSFKEIVISWPGRDAQIENGLQKYIEKNVNVGDVIIFESDSFYHPKKTKVKIGEISSGYQKKINKNLNTGRVKNVIRHSCGEHMKKKYPELYHMLHNSIKLQGWFYTVLVTSD